jgi:hypothetical protein
MHLNLGGCALLAPKTLLTTSRIYGFHDFCSNLWNVVDTPRKICMDLEFVYGVRKLSDPSAFTINKKTVKLCSFSNYIFEIIRKK